MPRIPQHLLKPRFPGEWLQQEVVARLDDARIANPDGRFKRVEGVLDVTPLGIYLAGLE